MFDVGFWEICLIGIIALIVIGPERLPRVARVSGMWIGKLRGMVRTVKHDIDEQLRLEELRQSMESQTSELNQNIDTLKSDIQSDIHSIESSAQTKPEPDDPKKQ